MHIMDYSVIIRGAISGLALAFFDQKSAGAILWDVCATILHPHCYMEGESPQC